MTDKESPSGWYAIMADGYRTHVCSRDLLESLWADAKLRHPKLVDRVPVVHHDVESVGYDMGGMQMVGMPWVDIAIGDGRSIGVFADQADSALIAARKRLKDSRVLPNGVRVVKLYGAYTIPTITLPECERFVAELERLLPECEAKLDALMAERRAEGLPTNRQELADHLQSIGARVFMPEMVEDRTKN